MHAAEQGGDSRLWRARPSTTRLLHSASTFTVLIVFVSAWLTLNRRMAVRGKQLTYIQCCLSSVRDECLVFQTSCQATTTKRSCKHSTKWPSLVLSPASRLTALDAAASHQHALQVLQFGASSAQSPRNRRCLFGIEPLISSDFTEFERGCAFVAAACVARGVLSCSPPERNAGFAFEPLVREKSGTHATIRTNGSVS